MTVIDRWYFGEDFQGYFIGVVESRQDPLELGRLQVRIFGVHNPSLTEIPSADLPWASVLQPLGGKAFATPKESDVVLGIWLDGAKQMPCVLGVLAGFESNAPSTGTGFHDLRAASVIADAPKVPVGRVYNTDGSGITIHEANTANAQVLESLRHPNADELDQATIPNIARYQNLANTVIAARKTNLDLNVPTAAGGTWSEPYPAYNPEYPYDNVIQTESGHVIEYDDTPGSERIHFAHRSGSFVEWFPTGTRVEKVTKSRYAITMADDHVHIMGRCYVTVDGDAFLLVKGDTVLECGADLSANIAGDVSVSIGGAFNLTAQSINMTATDDASLIGDSLHLTGDTSMDITSGATSMSSDGDLNLSGSGAANFGGGSVSIKGSVNIDGLESVNEGAAADASAAARGASAGIPKAMASLTKSTGLASPEQVPVPFDLTVLDPYTAVAYSQSQLLVAGANNSMVAPDSTTAANTTDCMFDPMQHTFIAQPWSQSPSGVAFLQVREGFAKVTSPDMVTAYPDPPGQTQTFAIGYGSTTPGIDRPVSLGELISRETAQSYLEYNISVKIIPYMQKYITVQLTQNMVDALCSFIYNIGVGGFSGSSTLKFINQQNWCAAGNAMLLWNRVGGVPNSGLAKRRSLERQLFLT